MSDHRSKRRQVIGLLVAAQVPCVALGLLSAVVVAHRMTVVQGYELAESVPLVLAVVATVYMVTLVVTLVGSLVIGLPLGALARKLGWRTWRSWRGLALRGVAVGQLAAPAVVFIVAVLGGEPHSHGGPGRVLLRQDHDRRRPVGHPGRAHVLEDGPPAPDALRLATAERPGLAGLSRTGPGYLPAAPARRAIRTFADGGFGAVSLISRAGHGEDSVFLAAGPRLLLNRFRSWPITRVPHISGTVKDVETIMNHEWQDRI